MFAASLFWFVLCLCLACVEIESEGKYGWAEKAPTWFRTTGPVARLYGLMMGSKPLTGYHAFMFFLPILIVHVPYFSGVPWSIVDEMKSVSLYLVVGALWDFLWFVLNPHYGIRKFTKKHVWWHAKSPWVFGLFPVDYLNAIIIATAAAGTGAYLGNDVSRMTDHLAFLGWLAAFTVGTIVVSPAYHRWYAAMRRTDDRDKTDIFSAD